MKPNLLLLLALVAAWPVQARLGDNTVDLKRRYGQPVGAEGTEEEKTTRFTYAWDRYKIVVTVTQGLSVSEEFSRADGREMTLQEVRDLLTFASDPGLSWVQVDGSFWKQKDRTAVWSARSLLVQEKALTKER